MSYKPKTPTVPLVKPPKPRMINEDLSIAEITFFTVVVVVCIIGFVLKITGVIS